VIWITGGQVFDVQAGRFRALDLGVRGERIERLVDRGHADPQEGDVVLDGREAFFLPGLIDCHVHLTVDSADADPAAGASKSDAEVAAYARAAAERTVRAGITSVRDLGGCDFLEMELRRAVDRGDVPGPRMFLAGRLLSMPTPATAYYPCMYQVASGTEEVRAAALVQIEQGADVIKVMATGAMLSPEEEEAGATQFTKEELAAAVETAEAHGIPVAAHAHAGAGIENAVEAGASSIEHGTFADDTVLRSMAERGVYLVPTSSAFASSLLDEEMIRAMPPHIHARFVEHEETHRDMVHRAHRAGVPIAMGTDAGTPGNHHGANALECVLLVEETGMTPADSIRAATLNAARLLRRDRDLGSLERGKLADVIGCLGDPTADIRELTRVAFVMKGGAVVRDDQSSR
jgi:imidazolonepropionase-like amidohydrolase